jgi:hypothetical protein
MAQASEHEDHHHHGPEIGLSNSLVYLINEKEFAYGLHVHFIHPISHTNFGVGLGYEKIFDEHGHDTFVLDFSYRPIHPLNLILSPGLAFEDNFSEMAFALHLETSYEFEIKRFHIGPALEFAVQPGDMHFSLGLHFGYEF